MDPYVQNGKSVPFVCVTRRAALRKTFRGEPTALIPERACSHLLTISATLTCFHFDFVLKIHRLCGII